MTASTPFLLATAKQRIGEQLGIGPLGLYRSGAG